MEKRDITTDLRNKLFAVIRAGMDLGNAPIDLSEADCEELMQIGARQSILPIIHRGLKNSGAPKRVVNECDRARLRDTKQFVVQNYSLDRIGAALDDKGIPYIPLKGAVLRHLYPSPELRTSSDIDILVKEEDLGKAVEAIENATDFTTLKKAYHDISMVNTQVHLELHFTIKENAESIDRLLDRAWEYARAADDGSSRFVFTPEFQVFHVVAHMSHHFLHGGLGIRPFLDLWLLKNKTEYDEAAVKDMCSECGILKFYEECCNLAQVWLEKKEYTETAAMLEEVCLSGGVFGSKQFKNAAKQRKQKGIRYLVNRIFPPAYEVKEYYRDETGRNHALPYYYLKRLNSWFGKNRRSELRKQINDTLAVDRNYLNTSDELIGRLGL